MPTAPTVVTGVRSSTVGINQDRRVVDMRNKIFEYDPDASPFLTIVSRRPGSVKASNSVFKHLEDQPLPWHDLQNGGATATATTVNVDTGAYFRGGHLVLNPRTAEIFKVVSVATNALTVIRAYTGDGINGVAMNDNDALFIIGSVSEEFSGAPTIKSTTEATVENYTEIFKDACGASESLSGDKLFGGAERPYQRRKTATQHNFSIERAFIHGKKKETTGAGGHRERSTGGILSWITSIAQNANGTLTAATLETWCEALFRYGSSTKLVLASRRAASQLDLISEGRLQTVVGQDSYGVTVKEFQSTHGKLLVTIHDMLVNYGGFGYADHMIALDMENLGKRFKVDSEGRARDSQLHTNIQNNDEDGWKDQYLSDVGLHVTLENAHGKLTGIV